MRKTQLERAQRHSAAHPCSSPHGVHRGTARCWGNGSTTCSFVSHMLIQVQLYPSDPVYNQIPHAENGSTSPAFCGDAHPEHCNTLSNRKLQWAPSYLDPVAQAVHNEAPHHRVVAVNHVAAAAVIVVLTLGGQHVVHTIVKAPAGTITGGTMSPDAVL